MATLSGGKKDILNILIILCIFTIANSLSAFVVYAHAIPEFSDLGSAIYSLTKIYMGDFRLLN